MESALLASQDFGLLSFSRSIKPLPLYLDGIQATVFLRISLIFW